MDERAYSCIAQIAGATGVKGAGVLVPGGHVLTCAHVVNQALGRRNENAERPAPQERVRVVFPWSGDGGRTYDGEVVAWFPLPLVRTLGDGCADIAVLQLDPPPPADLRPAWLQILEHMDSQRVRTAGFPAGFSLGRHAQGRLEGTDGGGWLQAISSANDMTFMPGHSGAPVFLDPGGTVVAMVAMIDDSKRDVALLIPTSLLQRAWPSLAQPAANILARNPYRGLETFRSEHRSLFKGRDGYITKVCQRLDNRRLVAIIGASGSGKSSLALAGVLPARADARWITTDFRPRNDPFRSLAAALIPHLEPSLTDPGPIWEAADRYADRFRKAPQELQGLAHHLIDRTQSPGLLIVVDQFEELFTQTRAAECASFLAFLGADCAAHDSPVSWLLTIRADFMEHALSEEGGPLPRLLQDADVMLGPMSEAELREAIELPARSAGVRFAPGLVERLIGDAVGRSHETATTDQEAGRRAGRLPLLEFALDALWHRQQAGEISHAAYDDPVVGVGGLDGALRRHAEAVYRELGKGIDGPARQERARRLFRRLVQRRQGGDDIRRVVPRSEVEGDWDDVVVDLAAARLVTTSEPEPGHATVEVIHEELLRAWPDLAKWVGESREFDLWREELNLIAGKWRDAAEGDKGDLLLRGRQLDKASVNLRERPSELNSIEVEFIEASRKRFETERTDRALAERKKLRSARVAAIAMTALAIVAGSLGVLSFNNLRASRDRLAESRLLEAQAALRRNDLASAVEAFGAVIDNLPSADPRAEAALAGITANLASAPRVVNNFGPIWGAALSVDADKVLVRRGTGQVEVFDASTGQKLPTPDIGLLQNDFQWMNFIDRYPIQLSEDGSIASLVFPAETFAPGTERTRPWAFTLAVWHPGGRQLIWKEKGEDFFVSHGPHGYLLIKGRNEDAEILRVGERQTDRLRLTGGTVVQGFPPTQEPYVVWRTGEPGNIRLALVDVDKIPNGHEGPVPENAVLWAHQIPSYFGEVRWQGQLGSPAFITRASKGSTWYCDITSCREITRRDFSLLSFATPPTKGTRPLDEVLASGDLEKAWPWGDAGWGAGWSQGPTPRTISFLGSAGLRVRDLYSGAQQQIRGIGRSVVASAWSRDGRYLWVIYADGQLVSLPIRAFGSTTSPTAPPGKYQGWTRSSISPNGDRYLKIESIYRSGSVRIYSAPLGTHSNERKTWELAIASDEITSSARFSRDGRHVILEDSQVTDRAATGKVRVLDAESGTELANFTTSGWIFDGDSWIGDGRRLAAVSKFPGDGRQIFAVCEWSERGLSRCSEPLETLANISRNGKYFVERRAYRTSVYDSSMLMADQKPVLEIAGTRSRVRFDRALLEFLFVNSESIGVTTTTDGAQWIGQFQGTTFAGNYSSDGRLIVYVRGQEFRYPANSFDEYVDRFWGPEMRVSALSADARHMVVDVSGNGGGEIWDVQTGTVLATLPLDGEVVFSSDSQSVLKATEEGAVDLLYLGADSHRPRRWSSEAAMSAFLQGRGTGEWRTADDVIRAISAAAKDGDPVSGRLSRTLTEAWGR